MKTTNKGKNYKCQVKHFESVKKAVESRINENEMTLIKLDEIVADTELSKGTVKLLMSDVLLKTDGQKLHPSYMYRRTSRGYLVKFAPKIEQKTLSL